MRRTKECAAQTREAILDAAETVFFRQGVAGTTLNQIACEAGLTRGAIYWHFSGKVDLFKAMEERASLPLERYFHRDHLLAEGDVLERLHLTTEAFLDFVPTDCRGKRVFTIILMRCEYTGEMQDALAGRRQEDARFRAMIGEVFAHAARDGVLTPGWPAPIAANAYVCALTGLLFEWLKREECFDLVTDGRALFSTLFSAFRRSPAQS